MAIDDIVNSAEAQAGITIIGQAEPLAVVTIKIGSVTKLSNAQGSGRIEAFFTAEMLKKLPEGSLTLTAYQKDRAGNLSPVTSVGIAKDTVPPPLATIDPITADNVLTAAERKYGFIVTGRTGSGQAVAVNVSGIKKTVIASASGTWSALVSQGDALGLPIGSVKVRATVTDPAGNASIASRTFQNT